MVKKFVLLSVLFFSLDSLAGKIIDRDYKQLFDSLGYYVVEASFSASDRSRYISIRSIRQVPHWPKAHYRFTVQIYEKTSKKEANESVLKNTNFRITGAGTLDLALSF